MALLSTRGRAGFWSTGALLVALPLGALSLSGCGAGEARASTTLHTGGQNGTSSSLTSVIRQMERAPYDVAYEGVRRVHLATHNPPVTFTEAVAGDGAGGFQLNPLEMISAHPDPELFLREQSQSKGYNYRYRGFRVQSAYLFQLNYQVSILSTDEVVAGVPCTQLHVERQGASAGLLSVNTPNHYVVDLDPQSGLVLRWREIDAFGALVAEVEFTSVQYGTPSAVMHPAAFDESELELQESLSQSVGFRVLRPGLLPQGFRIHRATAVLDGENRWIRQHFSDGLQSLLLMHSAKVSDEVDEGSTIGVLDRGNRTIITGMVNGMHVIAEGGLGSLGMQDFVSSCFE